MKNKKCKIKLKKNSVIYVLCPGGLVTGGPDALHQLAYYLTQLGYNAKMSYYGNEDAPVPELYKKYSPSVVRFKDIADERQNVIICPESATSVVAFYEKAQICVWWLGYINREDCPIFKKSPRVKFNNAVKKILNVFLPTDKKLGYGHGKPSKRFIVEGTDVINLFGSKYAYEQAGLNYKMRRRAMLVEPLSPEFLGGGYLDLTSAGRSDVVLYNPAKPFDVMTELLKRKDISFLPLRGYTSEELIKLFKKSKLYIDFGDFGGPERMPKESVLNGTLLLVCKRGAAVNDFDVAIPDKYKMENFSDVKAVAERIKYMLANYDKLIVDFAPFRNKIAGLKSGFIDSIKEIFVKE